MDLDIQNTADTTIEPAKNVPPKKFVYRIWLSRHGFSRYLSQHDTAAIFEQSIRRAELPIAFAGQFNPRMKISYYTSIPVGISSMGEPIDVTFRNETDPEEIQKKLQKNLPPDFGIERVEIGIRQKCWLQLTYKIIASHIIPEEKITELLARDEIWVFRTHNKKNVNIRPFILNCVCSMRENNSSTLEITLRADSVGSASVWELLQTLEIPLNDQVLFDITRTSIILVPFEP